MVRSCGQNVLGQCRPLIRSFSPFLAIRTVNELVAGRIQTKIISIEGEALTTVPTPRPMCDIFLETIQIALG